MSSAEINVCMFVSEPRGWDFLECHNLSGDFNCSKLIEFGRL